MEEDVILCDKCKAHEAVIPKPGAWCEGCLSSLRSHEALPEGAVLGPDGPVLPHEQYRVPGYCPGCAELKHKCACPRSETAFSEPTSTVDEWSLDELIADWKRQAEVDDGRASMGEAPAFNAGAAAALRSVIADIEEARRCAPRRPTATVGELDARLVASAERTVDGWAFSCPRCDLPLKVDRREKESIPRCRAETTFRDDEHKTYRCLLPKGHHGNHESGDVTVEWTDETTRPRRLPDTPDVRLLQGVGEYVDEWRDGDDAWHAASHIRQLVHEEAGASKPLPGDPDSIIFPLRRTDDRRLTCVVCSQAGRPNGKVSVDFEFHVGTTAGSAWMGIHEECIGRATFAEGISNLRQRLLHLWDEAHESIKKAAGQSGMEEEFATWSGATKDFLMFLGLEWDGELERYVFVDKEKG